MTPARLMLVDGTAVVYRAFFAIRELSDSSGNPTNAVFGFIRMIRQLQAVWKPTHLGVVFDGGSPQERLALLDSYKANRPPMPDPLRRQFEPIEEYLDASRVARIRMEAQEADDVIATLVERLRDDVGEVFVATSDKDLFQLVGANVKIVPPSKIGEAMGPEAVLEKTGVPPGRIVDWLALTGDSSDNIPGIPGLGPKTAAKLIGQFGSLDALLSRLDEVQPDRVRDALAAGVDQARRNLRLVSFARDLPVGVGLGDLAAGMPDLARLRAFLAKMEFRTLLRELDEPMLL